MMQHAPGIHQVKVAVGKRQRLRACNGQRRAQPRVREPGARVLDGALGEVDAVQLGLCRREALVVGAEPDADIEHAFAAPVPEVGERGNERLEAVALAPLRGARLGVGARQQQRLAAARLVPELVHAPFRIILELGCPGRGTALAPAQRHAGAPARALAPALAGSSASTKCRHHSSTQHRPRMG
jgi:hypothetical protein